MSSGFWKHLSTPFFVLAPMADVTDWPFRQVISQCGRPDVFYTEFVSADGLSSEKGKAKLLSLLHYTDNEHPIIAQIFGAHPESIYTAAKLIRDLGFDGLDINMGCPDRKVVKQGAGIGLCRTPELAREIIAAAREGLGASIPLTVKTRLGFDQINMGWIETLLKERLPALAVHLRTMKERSDVPAHWELAKEIVALRNDISPETLLIGNGDVSSRMEGIRKAQTYGLDGIMVGRGIFHNPWFFARDAERSRSPKERVDILKEHIHLFEEFWGVSKNFNVLKRFFKIYITGWEGAKELRNRLMQTKNTMEACDCIDSYQK